MEENGNGNLVKTGDTVIKDNNAEAAGNMEVCDDCEILDEEDMEEVDESDTQEEETDVSGDDVTAAAKSKTCTPPPLPPKLFDCVGVLYKSSKKSQKKSFCKLSGSQYYCVHNGRLIEKGNDYILVNHSFVNQSTLKPEQETRKFFKNKCPQYVDVKTTPDRGCKNNRKIKQNMIRPGECIGIEISGSGVNTPTGKDMKNGRYKNWVDTSDKSHCYLPIPLPSNLKYIFYFHYPKSSIKLTPKPELVPDCKPARLPKKNQKVVHVELLDDRSRAKPNTVC